MEKKYAELLADKARESIAVLVAKGIEHILKAADENKSSVDKWPLTFEIDKMVSSNQRVINAVVEKLEDEYGFVVFLQKEGSWAVDLPIEAEDVGSGEVFGMKEGEKVVGSFVVSAEEASQISACGREASSNAFFAYIDGKIKDAAKKGNNFVDFSLKEKMINKDARVMKRIYVKLKSLGFDCDESVKRDADKKVMFDKLETMRVKW